MENFYTGHITISIWEPTRKNKYTVRGFGFSIYPAKEGTLIKIPMVSKREVVGKFIKVENCLDPRDMFFANIQLLYYADCPNMPFIQKNEWLANLVKFLRGFRWKI